MAQFVLPRVHAMMLCDCIEESDREADVFHLTGVRTVVEVSSFPAVLARFCVFLHMTGHPGEAFCRIQVLRDETDDVVYKTAPKAISFDDRTSVVPIVFRLRNCVFPASGVYYVQTFHESNLIGERPLDVRQED